MISIEELASRLQRSTRTVYRLLYKGELDAFKERQGNTWVFREKLMGDWIDLYKRRTINFKKAVKWYK